MGKHSQLQASFGCVGARQERSVPSQVNRHPSTANVCTSFTQNSTTLQELNIEMPDTNNHTLLIAGPDDSLCCSYPDAKQIVTETASLHADVRDSDPTVSEASDIESQRKGMTRVACRQSSFSQTSSRSGTILIDLTKLHIAEMDQENKKEDGVEDQRDEKEDGVEDQRDEKEDGVEDQRDEKEDGVEDQRDEKEDGVEDQRDEKEDGVDVQLIHTSTNAHSQVPPL